MVHDSIRHLKNSAVISSILLIILVSTSTSCAWDNRGHMMVAAVAYQTTKDPVDALLLLGTQCGRLQEIFRTLRSNTSGPRFPD